MDGVKYALGFPDAAGSPRRFGPDRDRKQSLEEMSRSMPRPSGSLTAIISARLNEPSSGLTEIGEAEQGVAVRVKLGREPDAFAERVEKLDDRNVIDVAITAVGELLAQLGREEDHAALLSVEGSACSSVLSAGTRPSSQSAALLAGRGTDNGAIVFAQHFEPRTDVIGVPHGRYDAERCATEGSVHLGDIS
jgi:hypothetical protein